MRNTYKKVMLISTVVIISLAAMVLYTVTTPYGENIVRHILEKQLSRSLGLTIEISTFETNMVSRIHLSGIHITHMSGDDEHSLLKAGDVLVRYKIWRLLRTRPSMETVSIDSLNVSIVRDSTGFRLPLSRGGGEGTPQGKRDFMVQFGHFDVLNSTIAFDELTIPLHVLSQNITVNLQEAEAGMYVFRLDSDNWDVEYEKKPVPVKSLSAAGILSPEKISIESCNLVLDEMECDVETVINLDTDPVNFDGRVHVSGQIKPLKPLLDTILPRDKVPTGGTIDAEILFSGPPEDPELSFFFAANDILFKNMTCRKIDLKGNVKDRLLTLEKGEISLFDGTITGKGQLSVDSLFAHDLELEFQRIDLNSVWNVLDTGPSPYSGYIDGHLETHGPLRNPLACNAAAHVTLKNIQFKSRSLNDFNGNVSFENHHLSVDFMQPKTDFNAHVVFAEKAVSGTFGLRTTNPAFLAGFAHVFDLKGMLDIDGEISGTTTSPRIKMGFSGKDIQYLGFPVDSIQGGITYDDGDIIIEESVFTGALASFDSLSGPIKMSGLHGGGVYSGTLRGNVQNLDGHIDLDLVSPQYKGFSADNIHAEISIEENRLDIANALLVKDTFIASLNGGYDIKSKKGTANFLIDTTAGSDQPAADSTRSAVSPDKGQSPGTVTVEWSFADTGAMSLVSSATNVAISDIIRVKKEPVMASGIIDYNFRFEGPFNKPEIVFTAEVASPTYKNTSFDSLSVNTHIIPDRFILKSLDVFVNGQKTATHGEIALKQSESDFPIFDSESGIDVTSQGYNVSIELLKQFMPQDMQLSGNSKFNLDFKGTIGKPAITGNIAFSNTELSVRPDYAPLRLDVQASLNDSILVINNASGSIGTVPISISGNCVTYDWEKFGTELSIGIAGNDVFKGAGQFTGNSLQYQANVRDFDMSLLREFFPQIENPGGMAHSQLDIAGPYNDPHVTGQLDIRNIEFRSPFFSEAINQGTLLMRFDRKSVSIDSLSAFLGKGWISGKGTVSHEKKAVSNVDLALSAGKLNFDSPKQYSILIDSARLSCVKQNGYYNLDGEIVMGESRFIKNFDIKKLPLFMQKVERPSQDPSPFATNLRMNVLIRNNKNLWIDNNLAHFRVRSDLGLIGTLARPNLTGRITVEEGYLIYLDRKFRISKGVMEFIDPNRLNPLISLTTSTSLKNYQSLSGIPYAITLNVEGPLDDAVFSLTSEPPLDKPDIMALLTIGVTRSQLSGQSTEDGSASLNEALKERAAALSSQKISGYVTERAGSILGLEEISIEGNLFNAGKSSGPQLITSEKINDRMGITYSTAVGHLNDQRIRLDYKLNRHFSLVGETDQRGRSALDVKYKLRFK